MNRMVLRITRPALLPSALLPSALLPVALLFGGSDPAASVGAQSIGRETASKPQNVAGSSAPSRRTNRATTPPPATTAPPSAKRRSRPPATPRSSQAATPRQPAESKPEARPGAETKAGAPRSDLVAVTSADVTRRVKIASDGVVVVEFPAGDALYAVHAGNVNIVAADIEPTANPGDPIVFRPGEGFSAVGQTKTIHSLQFVSGLFVTLIFEPTDNIEQNNHRLILQYDIARIRAERAAMGLAANLARRAPSPLLSERIIETQTELPAPTPSAPTPSASQPIPPVQGSALTAPQAQASATVTETVESAPPNARPAAPADLPARSFEPSAPPPGPVAPPTKPSDPTPPPDRPGGSPAIPSFEALGRELERRIRGDEQSPANPKAPPTPLISGENGEVIRDGAASPRPGAKPSSRPKPNPKPDPETKVSGNAGAGDISLRALDFDTPTPRLGMFRFVGQGGRRAATTRAAEQESRLPTPAEREQYRLLAEYYRTLGLQPQEIHRLRLDVELRTQNHRDSDGSGWIAALDEKTAKTKFSRWPVMVCFAEIQDNDDFPGIRRYVISISVHARAERPLFLNRAEPDVFILTHGTQKRIVNTERVLPLVTYAGKPGTVVLPGRTAYFGLAIPRPTLSDNQILEIAFIDSEKANRPVVAREFRDPPPTRR